MEVAALVAEWVTAIATAAVAIAAPVQLPLIAEQVRGLSEQIRLSREADLNAERRTREWETLKAVEKHDSDPILDAATARIWIASARGHNYASAEIDPRDIVCVMNYLDGLATGIQQGLYIEDVIKDHLAEVFRHAIENFVYTTELTGLA